MALPQTIESIAAAAQSAVTVPARPSLDRRGGMPLPKPLKTFAPYRDLLTALRGLSAAPGPTAVAVAELPETASLRSATTTAIAVLLSAPPGALLRDTLETLAHAAGLRRATATGAAAPEAAAEQAGRPALAALSLDELAAAVEAETAFQSLLHDGMTLASDARALGAAADLAQQLRAGSDLAPLALAGAAARRSEGGPDQRTDRFLRATESLLLRLLAKGAGTTAFAMAVAQVYLGLAAPFVRLAAGQQAGAGSLPEEAAPARAAGVAGSAEPQSGTAGTGAAEAGHSEDVAAVLRDLLARDAITANSRDLALLSTDLGRLLAHHRRGLQRLREARGFLAAVRATASPSQRRQPLGVLLEAGRPAAAGMAASGRAALLRALTSAGSEGGVLLDGLARAAAEGGERSLAAVLSASAGGEGDRPGQALAAVSQAALARLAEEARTAAQRLHGVLTREIAAADRLSGQLEGLHEGRGTLRR